MPSSPISLIVAAALSGIPAISALYVPGRFSMSGGSVGAISNGNGIQAVWGPNGYSTNSFGPGFTSQASGQFGLNNGAISNSISRVQVFPAIPEMMYPYF
ncbi:hypothetical protein GGI13_006821 [Coemansia sp. RSA 455]|nr:hypothetical protein GGH13_007814 [Coemansia sp. S155-1]KAJ2242831.1 hypothetical protein GGI13_006821 [Coemansia sp. RSA 455]